MRWLRVFLGTNFRQARQRAKPGSDEAAETADETGAGDANGAKPGIDETLAGAVRVGLDRNG
jgi:hypothetical protein